MIRITFAPLALTSLMLLIVLLAISSSVTIATTGVPGSIKEIEPCFNSPAAYASQWI